MNKMDHPYRMMRHQGLIDCLQNLSNPIVKVKVVLNGQKMDTLSFPHQARLRSILPDLENDKVYSLNVYYKENGYYMIDLSNLILFKNDNKILIYKDKGGHLSKPKPDYLLFGYSTKKVIIQETTKNIYHLHIESLPNPMRPEESSSVSMIGFEHNEMICRDDNEEIDMKKHLDRILCNYLYHIENIEYLVDQDKLCCQSDRGEISVQVEIEGKRNIWRRFLNYLFHK